jgi:hypothetical protein
LEQTIVYLMDAKDIQEELAHGFPGDNDFQVDYGWTLASLAEMHLFKAATCEAQDERSRALATAAKYARSACSVYNAAKKDEDPLVVRGLALSRALHGELLRDTNSKVARGEARAATEQISRLEELTGDLDQDDYFTLALARAVLRDDAQAIEALTVATHKGTNSLQRLRSHTQFAFHRLSQSPKYQEELQQLVDKIKQRTLEPPSQLF